MVIINLVVIAQFFHITCIVIINYLIAFGKQDGVLGPICHHYDVVETNGRSTLHLHYIPWLSGNLNLADIWT